MTRVVEGEVLRLRCCECGSPTDDVMFSGDTDTATQGLVSLASIVKPEVVITLAGAGEWCEDQGVVVGRRLSNELGRTDLRFVPLLRTEDHTPTGVMSFKEFKAVYRPPKLFFACPHCAVGEARVEGRMAFGAYEREGGRLTLVGDLKLAS